MRTSTRPRGKAILARARALIEQGVDVDAGNRYGATALFFAAEKGDLDMVVLLVEHGARLDIEDSFYNMSALSRAMSGEHFDVARFLLSRGSPGADAVLRVGVANEDRALVEAALAAGDVTRPAYDRALEIAAGGVRALLEAAEVPEGAPAEAVELSRALSSSALSAAMKMNPSAGLSRSLYAMEPSKCQAIFPLGFVRQASKTSKSSAATPKSLLEAVAV